MKKLIRVSVLALALICTSIIVAQDCPEPTPENYKKVTSSAFVKDFEDCPVIIEATYYKEGYAKGYRKPKKLNNMYFFQTLSDDGVPSVNPLSQDETGDFIVVDKAMADEAIELKRGDRIRLTGTTYQQNYLGQKLHVFFIATGLEKIE